MPAYKSTRVQEYMEMFGFGWVAGLIDRMTSLPPSFTLPLDLFYHTIYSSFIIITIINIVKIRYQNFLHPTSLSTFQLS